MVEKNEEHDGSSDTIDYEDEELKEAGGTEPGTDGLSSLGKMLAKMEAHSVAFRAANPNYPIKTKFEKRPALIQRLKKAMQKHEEERDDQE